MVDGTANNGIRWNVANARIPQDEYRRYYIHLMEMFCESLNPSKVAFVNFGKEDIRGAHGITLHFTDGGATDIIRMGSMKQVYVWVSGYIQGPFLLKRWS